MNLEQIMDDIKKIDKVLKSGKESELKDMHQYLVGTYETIIRQTRHAWKETDNEYIKEYNEDRYHEKKMDLLTDKEVIENHRFNLSMIRSKLRLSIPNKQEDLPSTIINVSSSSTAENHNQINIEINVTFDDVREQVRSMESTLDERDVKEILEKIDALEKIIESDDKKYVKWKKARSIGKWILDKSVDVGIALLPLYLKIGA